MRLALIALAGLFLTFPAAIAPPAIAQSGPISAEEMIGISMATPTLPVGPQWVEMDVCGTGVAQGRVFLNSLEDYRDRASLNAFIPPWHRAVVGERIGGDPAEVLLGHKVRVYGVVRQVRINLLDENGAPTGEFYFQTQMAVMGPDDVRLVMEEGEPARAQCGPMVS